MLISIADASLACGLTPRQLRPLATSPGTGRAALVDTRDVARRAGLDEATLLDLLSNAQRAALALRSAARGLIS